MLHARARPPHTYLVVFDGSIPQNLYDDNYYQAFRRYMLATLGCQKLWTLYLVDGKTTRVSHRQHLYELAYGLDTQTASTLLIKSMHPRYEDISPEDKATASDIVEVSR